MIVHPVSPELNGKVMDGYKDADGKQIFVEWTNLAVKEGEAFYEYSWPKPGFKDPVKKISRLKHFKEWKWIIGTGVYVDDVEAEISALTTEITIFMIIVFGFTVLIGFLIAKYISELDDSLD